MNIAVLRVVARQTTETSDQGSAAMEICALRGLAPWEEMRSPEFTGYRWQQIVYEGLLLGAIAGLID